MNATRYATATAAFSHTTSIDPDAEAKRARFLAGLDADWIATGARMVLATSIAS
ncbi:hypothetical protein [Nocardia puris]|uniref:Uncharacterized protein n=1 Tax=Nocardia puris TaxID=208602 RepID=A0A366CXM2_9NOCA|nr:hypothetical protein [Nocardia puris]RBO82396.1 hypothetical protein DFR74_12313 [Nocardia puris]